MNNNSNLASDTIDERFIGVNVSKTTTPGIYAREMETVALFDILYDIKRYAQYSKEGSYLIHPGFSIGEKESNAARMQLDGRVSDPEAHAALDAARDMRKTYPRLESEFDYMNCIILDCDNDIVVNGEKRCKDRNGLNVFKLLMREMKWASCIWETPSSTKEWPRWRAVIPIYGWVRYTKYVKEAISSIFGEFSDAHATWFFLPTQDKLDTVWMSKGMPFDASLIISKAQQLEKEEKAKKLLAQVRRDKYAKLRAECAKAGHPLPCDWHNLPSVKKCFDACYEGERNTSINTALFAMGSNGYGNDAQQAFLDEISQKYDLGDNYDQFVTRINGGEYTKVA